jgi:hypothetical protein
MKYTAVLPLLHERGARTYILLLLHEMIDQEPETGHG